MNTQDALDRIRRVLASDMSAGGASAVAIAQAESALGVTFPPSYRLFLTHWGAGTAGRYEVSGINAPPSDPNEPPRWPSVVQDTLLLRRASRGDIPNHFLPISADGGDYQFFLDTADCDSTGECSVRVLGPGRDGEIVARTFLEFLELAVHDRLHEAY